MGEGNGAPGSLCSVLDAEERAGCGDEMTQLSKQHAYTKQHA